MAMRTTNPKYGVTKLCECGCGTTINAYHEVSGVPRRFVTGHSARVMTPKRLAYMEVLRGRNHTNTWNRGKTYVFAKKTAYANKGAWADALRRLFPDKCMRCGWNEATTDTHHIIPKSEGGRFTVENGIILCPNCHRLAEVGKISREQLREIRDSMVSTTLVREATWHRHTEASLAA